MLHSFERRQVLRCDLTTAWQFLSNPENLAKITPDFMGFRILSNPETLLKMYPGQIIEYTVSPVAGINLHWVTEITHVKELDYFVDEQRFGPYTFWHHQHFLIAHENGVEMRDIVHYKIPFGIIGKLVNTLFVKNKLQQIFDYREKVLREKF